MNIKRFLAFSLDSGELWLLAGLLLSAFASVWLLRSLEQNDKPAAPVVDAHLPDYTASDYTATKLDRGGRIEYQLQALETLGYPESGTELTEPYLVFYIDAQPAWYVRAQSGQVSADRQTVWLLGETRLWRYNALNEWELQVVTRDVMLKPEDQYAQTDAPALITAPGGFMQGVGLRAYLPERRLELLAQVKGQYEKP